jgi:hypothetical protein
MLRINLLLVVLGAVGGALAAIPLTSLGKVLAGAPEPATMANYLWNMRVLGVMGALFGPVLAWSSLRLVPLWRATLEPALGAVVGAALGMATGFDALFLLGTACGVAFPVWRLNRAYRDRVSLPPADSPATAQLEP